MLRSALLPFDEFARWSASVITVLGTEPGNVTSAGGAASGSRTASSLELLRKFVDQPAFIEAIRVASPSLYHALAEWLAGRGKNDSERLEQSLIRYFSRASYRATPFGLFAGCSLVAITDATNLELCPRADYTRRSRLDMDHVAELARAVMADPEARRRLPLYANSSAVTVGSRLHYVEVSYKGRRRQYDLTGVDLIPEIRTVLSAARDGTTYSALAAILAESGFEQDEIDEFLTDLIDTQLLVPGVEPQLTGAEAGSVLATDLERAGCGREICDALRTVTASLERLDVAGVSNPPEAYDAALAPMAKLPVSVDPSKILQVDLYKPSPSLSLGGRILDDLIVAAETIPLLTERFDRLAEFATRFQERYETREVTLLEALDDEIGIGLPDSSSSDQLMRGLVERMRQREVWLGELRLRAAREEAMSVELTNSDLTRLRSSDRTPIADAISVVATIVAESSEHVNRGEYRLLVHYVTGPSGARMLGRFAHLHDDFERAVRDHVRAEEALHPDVVFAEIVHVPQGRIGNIAARPLFRDYEITYLGRSGVPRANQILASDLAISVRSGRVTLRSISMDREVRPRLSCAHNYSSPSELPVYKFLAMLQEHGVRGTSTWSWGALANASFLPRVTFGRLIYARATWTVSAKEIKSLTESADPRDGDAFAMWREQRGLPRHVVLADADNRLPVDCDNPASTRTLLRLLRGRHTATIEEMYPDPDSLCVHGPEGRFTHEIVVPLIRKAPAGLAAPAQVAQVSPSIRVRVAAAEAVRAYPPGGEWIYAKLYCGRGSGDHVLRTLVVPLVARLTAEGLVDRHFFLRYMDPQFHLRLRFHATGAHSGRVMQIMGVASSPLVEHGLASRLVFDSYLPEVERYGGAFGIALAETVFHADSVAALAALTRQHDANGGSPAIDRDLIALASLDRLFGDARLGISRRIEVLERRLGAPTAVVRRARSARFRARRAAVARAVAHARGVVNDVWLADVLDRRSTHVQPAFDTYRELESTGDLIGTFDDILLSFAHMSVNRLTPDAQAAELTLYDFLHRHYLSERARSGSDPSSARAERSTPTVTYSG